MATPLAHSSSSFHVTASAVVRSDSLASSASGQSTASLSRRPRTRSRPRALTLNAPKPREKAAQPGVPDVPMLTAPEMFDAAATGMLDASRVPDRPLRSPLREQPSLLSSSPVEITARDSFATTDDAAFELRNQNVRLEDEVERRRRKRGSSVPRDAYRLSFLSSASSPTSSLFPYQHPMHMQTMPNFPTLRETRQRLRDSYLTAFSGTSTSVYPFSTSTGSGTDSPPSPRSLVESYHDQAIRHVSPDDKDEAGFDPDDVSYRLRLMLNNSYFLPPAHSKPSPAQLGPISPEVKKPQAKGFLELFRPRSKSKPESPITPTNPQDPVPVLRTTSDGSTMGFQRTPPTQSSAVSPNVPNAPAQTARVAVVRETLDDLMAAAKQAEREIKALETQDAAEKKPAYDDVIDPTDAIDLPPPATNSLVPVQTSTLVGLGVEQSVGAAELAVQLPPGTPSWSIDPNDSWRKALLHEAVSLSLESTPTRPQHSVRKQMSDASMSTGMTSANQSGSTSMSSGTTNTRSRSATSVVNRRILMPDRLEDVAETGVQIPAHSSAQWPTLRTHASVPDARSRAALSPSLVIPSMPTRVESPQMPHTPLLPPPRKGQFTQMGLSNVESSRSTSPTHSASSLGVRQSSSSPRLHSEYDLAPSHRLSQLAEPSGTQHIPKTSLDSTESESTLEGRRSLSPSVTTSIGNMSLSAPPTPDPHRPSPTQSAFRDARIDSYRPSLSSNASTPDLGGDAVTQCLQPPAVDPPARSASIPSEETLLPPPRTSSSLAYTPLRPPPRSSSFMTRPVPSSSKRIREPSPRPSISSSDPGHSVFVSAVDLREPSPHRPSTARSEQARSPYLPRASTSSQGSHSRHRRGHADVALQAPGAMISHALRDVPATSIEFFDQVEAAGRADEWGDEDDGAVSSSTDDYGSVWAAPMRNSPSPSASPRPSHHSSRRSSPHRTPQKARPAISSSDSLPLPPRSPISGPVGNTPARTIGYFKDTRSPGTALEPVRARLTRPATAPSSARAVQDDVASIYSGESHESAVSTGRIGLGRTPSMLRLDGMLMRHMEAEREAFQRIAKASKAGSVRSGTT